MKLNPLFILVMSLLAGLSATANTWTTVPTDDKVKHAGLPVGVGPALVAVPVSFGNRHADKRQPYIQMYHYGLRTFNLARN